MGGRGSGGRSQRQPTDAEIANEVDRDTMSQPRTEQVPADRALYAAIEELGGRNQHGWAEYVALVDLRPLLGGTREEQDANLKRLSREGVISIVPESDRKALRDDDHDAAIQIGGEANHLVQWNYIDHPDRPEAQP